MSKPLREVVGEFVDYLDKMCEAGNCHLCSGRGKHESGGFCDLLKKAVAREIEAEQYVECMEKIAVANVGLLGVACKMPNIRAGKSRSRALGKFAHTIDGRDRGADGETVHSPTYTLNVNCGDEEDLITLLHCLCKKLGWESRILIQRSKVGGTEILYLTFDVREEDGRWMRVGPIGEVR